MSGKLAQKPSITRYSGFNTIGESMSNSLSSNVAGATFSNTSLRVPRVGVVPITGIAAMGNLAIASAGGLPTVDRDNLLMEQPITIKTTQTKPKLTVANSMDSGQAISLDSKSSKQSRKNLTKLKNTQHSSSLSNQSVHGVQSARESISSKARNGSRQSTIDKDRNHLNELKNQSSASLEETNKSTSSNHSHHLNHRRGSPIINSPHNSQHSNQGSPSGIQNVHNKELSIDREHTSVQNSKSASKNTLSRQSTNQSDSNQSDNIHSDSSLINVRESKDLKSLTNSKSDLRQAGDDLKKPVSKSIENLSAGRKKALTAEQRRSRLATQLSQPSSLAQGLTAKLTKGKRGPSSIEI